MQQLSELQRKLLAEIKKDPTLTNRQYAELIGSTANGAQEIIAKLVARGYIVKQNLQRGEHRKPLELVGEVSETETTKNNTSTFEQKGDKAEYTFFSNKRIVSLEDLKQACDIDLTDFEIERLICNKWEVGAKDNTGKIEVTPLFQVKVWLKPRVPNTYLETLNDTIAEIKRYAPKYPVIQRQRKKEPVILILDPADPHFGKYASIMQTGEDYNIEIAVKRYTDCFEGILNKSSRFELEKIVIIGGNDVLHIDSLQGTTTKGTPQDVDGNFYNAIRAAKECNIAMIERALTISDVHFVHVPSNHDELTGFMLANTIQSWFHNNKQITFDISEMFRKYIHYGVSAIGLTHADKVKEVDLGNMLATEAKEAWSKSEYGYFYCHDRHHKIKNIKSNNKMVNLEKDNIGYVKINTGKNLTARNKVHVEFVRSISATDKWHSKHYFQHAMQAMEGFIHHPEFGQTDRLTHIV